MTARSRLLLLLSALGALVLACALPLAAPEAAPGGTAPPGATAGAGLTVTVRESAYGRIVVATRPAAACDVRVALEPGRLGDRPPGAFSGQADAAGLLEWTYPAPPQPAQRAEHIVLCRSGPEQAEARSHFAIDSREPKAAGFSVRLAAAEPPPEVSADPALVPLRDALLDRLRARLAAEWSAATRGLGSLRIVEEPAEVLVKVLAARSTSVHVRAGDGSREIRVYVADDEGHTQDLENLVATTLHELGHIWCCSGPDADAGGHWAQALEDPELAGVDRFGLMNHPVRCTYFGTVLSCPNRFSQRELLALGFTDIPPPPPDPCLTQAAPLDARIAQLDGLIAAERAAIAAHEATLASIRARIAEIERRYGSSLPPDVYDEYTALVARHNSLLLTYRGDLAEHNAYVAERNERVVARQALPC